MAEELSERDFIVKLRLSPELAEPVRIIARAKGISAPKLVENWVRRLVEKNGGLITRICEQLGELDID